MNSPSTLFGEAVSTSKQYPLVHDSCYPHMLVKQCVDDVNLYMLGITCFKGLQELLLGNMLISIYMLTPDY